MRETFVLTARDQNAHVTSPWIEKIAESIGELSAFLCREEFSDGEPNSTILVYFSGILGFSRDGSTFERVRNYTPKLSALIYCARLCLLELILPRYSHAGIRWLKRPTTGGLDILNPALYLDSLGTSQALV
jgi:hypothetical protein